jgi:hypothetical protein
MSAYLDGLVRRGAGLGAAPGEQMAALRPLSRFEQPALEAAGAGVDGLSEQESLIPVAAPLARDSAPAGEHAALPRTAAARAPITEASPPAQEPAPSGHGAAIEAAMVRSEGHTVPVRPDATSEPIVPPRALSSPTAPVMPAASNPVDLTPTDRRGDPQPHDAPDVTLHAVDDDAPAVVRRPIDTSVAASEVLSEVPPRHMPVVSIDDRQIETMLADDRASGRTFVAPPDRFGPEPDGEVERTPSMSIAIGRIEIDFGQRPAAPAPAPTAQRTRGFEAYARARRGQLR